MKPALTILVALLLSPLDALPAAGRPVLYWSAEPVMPGETAMLRGSGFDSVIRIELKSGGKSTVVPVLDVYAANAMMRHILFDNQWSDTGIAAQLYGGALDCVMAGNRSARSGGFRAWGNETAWYVQMLGNQITEGLGTIGPEANAGSSMLHVVGPYLVRNNIRFTGTTARGIVMRRNVLHNNATITLRGAIHDVLLENNQIKHSAQGIIGDLWQRQSGVLLRGNTLEDVTTEHAPPDAGYRTVDP